MSYRHWIPDSNPKKESDIQVRELTEDEVKIHREYANRTVEELKVAIKSARYDQYERLDRPTTFNAYDPFAWLIDFLVDKENIIIIARRTWSELKNLWFATGEDAYWKIKSGAMWSYFITDSANSFLVVYYDVDNAIFLVGNDAMVWAQDVKNRIYDTVGLSSQDYDIYLLDTKVENWGRRLVLDCAYKPTPFPMSHTLPMTIIFTGCNRISFEGHHPFYQRHTLIYPKFWMWMGYKPDDALRMMIPAHIHNLSVDVKFSYEEITVIKNKNDDIWHS